MLLFDVELSVQDVTIGVPSPELLESGTPPYVELGVLSGIALPIPHPQTGQPIPVPVGKLRFTFSRSQAIDTFTAALKAAEELPEEPSSGKVMIAQSMSDVERAAQNIKRITGH